MRRPSQRHFAPENLDSRLRAGLVGHWIGGGSGNTWLDRSGYGNHGALTNGPTWTLGAGGKRHALRLDGSDDHVAIAGTIPPATSAYTIALCARRDAITGFGVLVGLTANYADSLWAYDNGDLGFGDANGLWVRTAAGWTDLSSFHHIAVVVSVASQTATLYFDGASMGAINGASSGAFASSKIGRFAGASGTQFPGVLDYIRIYDRALSPAEIALLAQPSFLPVVPRRWFVGLLQLTTAATSSVSTWVSPTAATRASVAASPSIASWASPTASTKASVSASPSVSTWVVPNATTRTPRIFPTVSVSRTVYSNIPASRTVYDPIEVS